MQVIYRFTILALSLMLLASSGWAERDISAGVQKCHLRQVLHVTADGRTLRKYDPAKSFIPLTVWSITSKPMEMLASGGFNSIVIAGIEKIALDDPVEREKLMARCKAAGVRLVPAYVPKTETLRALKGNPYILAYLAIDEPNRFLENKDDPIEPAYTNVLAAQARIWENDPGRAMWVNLVPRAAFKDNPAQLGWWYTFNSVPEIASNDCYPVVSPETTFADVAGAVAEQVAVNQDRRPTFFIAQGCKDKVTPPWPDRIFPTPAQFQCAIYSSIVHGAVGFGIFKVQEDDWKAHPGIGPNTTVSTGTPEELAKQERELNIITPADARRSRELWKLATEINTEITKMRQVILTPTADIDYRIKLLESKGGTGIDIPVRTLVKQVGGWSYLYVVNIDNGEFRVSFDFPASAGRIRDLSLIRGGASSPTAQQSSIADTLEPFAVRIYKFRLRR